MPAPFVHLRLRGMQNRCSGAQITLQFFQERILARVRSIGLQQAADLPAGGAPGFRRPELCALGGNKLGLLRRMGQGFAHLRAGLSNENTQAGAGRPGQGAQAFLQVVALGLAGFITIPIWQIALSRAMSKRAETLPAG